MKKIQILLILILILFVSSTYSYGADITFSQALESLYGTHEGMAQAEADYKQKEYAKKAALGLYSPRISLNAAYAYFGNDLTMDVDLSPISNTVNGVLGSLPIPLPPLSLPSTMEQVVQQDQFF